MNMVNGSYVTVDSSRTSARQHHVRFAPEGAHQLSAPRCPLCAVVSSGRRNTLSQTQEMEWTGDGSKLGFEVSMRWPAAGSCGTAGGAHSQLNRVAQQLNKRSPETLGFETRAERDLMPVLHRPIEPTG
jgi:hypothetical protein